MLSSDLEIRDLDARHWANWWRLLVPPRVMNAPRWALVVLDGGSPVRVMIGHHGGTVTPIPELPPVTQIDRWAKILNVAAVVAIDKHVVVELAAEIEPQLSIQQDIAEQGLIALRAIKKRAGKGIWSEPSLLELLPTPGYDGVQRTFDLLVPDNTALLAYVVEDDRSKIHSSIIAVKDAGDIALAATHKAIADLVPEATLARTWDKDGYKRVLDAVEDRFAKPSIAVFLERATLRRIITGPSDQFARELNAKKVVIDPAPAWLLGLLGGATMVAMAGRAGRAIAQMLPQSARDRASSIASKFNPWSQLGFDPIELWSRLRHFYRD